MTHDRRLTEAETASRDLPSGPCCCREHSHSWYERRHDGETWIECNHCAEARR